MKPQSGVIPVGWTLRDTSVQRVILETSAGWIIDRGYLAIDSLYRVDETHGVEVEYALSWTDRRLGARLWINTGDNATLPGMRADVLRLVTPRGNEVWYTGEAAEGAIERKFEEWTGALAS